MMIERVTAYRIARVVVGCFFAEAVFLLVQILLTVIFLRVHYSFRELLSASHPFYALPPHFYVVGVVFVASVLYGELKGIRLILYYTGCGFLAAIAFHAALFLFDGVVMQASMVVINFIAAVLSGLVYWALIPRRRL